MDVLDVLEAAFFEFGNGLAASEATGEIDEHGLGFVEYSDFAVEGLVAEGDVHGVGECSAFEFGF